MRLKLAFISHVNEMRLHCTYCWQTHIGYMYGGEVLVIGGCGHDARRYFTNHDDYIAYVRAYDAVDGDHDAALATVGRGDTVGLPLFEGIE